MESFPITVCGQRNLLYSGFLWIAAATISCRLLEGLVLQGFLHPPSPAAEVGDLENLRKLEIAVAGCGGYGGRRGWRHSNDRPSRGLLLLLLLVLVLLLVVTQGGRCVADTVPVRRQPGRVGIDQISPSMM